MLTALREWSQKRTLRTMLKDPRSTRGFRSTGQLEKGIGADRSTTERRAIKKGVETRGLIIKVLCCFHQNNDDSKCEVAHTSPPVSRFKIPQFRTGRRLQCDARSYALPPGSPTPAISISEIHNQLHLESLPVQHIED